MGQPFCFHGSANINVLSTLTITWFMGFCTWCGVTLSEEILAKQNLRNFRKFVHKFCVFKMSKGILIESF